MSQVKITIEPSCLSNINIIYFNFPNDNSSYICNSIVIKRKKIDDINFVEIYKSADLNIIKNIQKIIDISVLPGVIYEYQIIINDSNSNVEQIFNFPSICCLNTSIDFVSKINSQDTKLKYLTVIADIEVSNYKNRIIENKIELLSNRYPIFTRDSDNYYREFSINGLLSANLDEHNLLLMEHDRIIYNNIYNIINREHGIHYNKDYYLERLFREEAVSFLYDNKYPKLLKSLTEGNHIVRLKDITLSPKNEVNNLVYNFSCTAYEVDSYEDSKIFTEFVKVFFI